MSDDSTIKAAIWGLRSPERPPITLVNMAASQWWVGRWDTHTRTHVSGRKRVPFLRVATKIDTLLKVEGDQERNREAFLDEPI